MPVKQARRRWISHRDQVLQSWIRWCRVFVDELRSSYPLSAGERFKAWRQGFSQRDCSLYGLPDEQNNNYIGELSYAFRAWAINDHYSVVFADKLMQTAWLKQLGLPCPRVISTIYRGEMFSALSGERLDAESALLSSFEESPIQVFRPVHAWGGQGVFFVRRENNGWLLNGKELTSQDLKDQLASLHGYITTEFVPQASYAERIHPPTTNTLRVLTLWDREAGHPYVAATCQRFGSSRSGIVDTFGAGNKGLSAPVDQSGILGSAVTLNAQKVLARYDRHPDTNETIKGVGVPNLDQCLDGALTAAQSVPLCPLLGWDMVMTEDGYQILEANPMPGLSVWQVHQPLLENCRDSLFAETFRKRT